MNEQVERHTMFLDWKNQYCENDYYPNQSTDSVQSLSNYNGIFFTELEQKFTNLYGNAKNHKHPEQP